MEPKRSLEGGAAEGGTMAAVTRSDAAQGRLRFMYNAEDCCDTAVGVTSESGSENPLRNPPLLTCPPTLVAAVQAQRTLSEEAFPELSASAVEQLIQQTWTEFFGPQGRLHQLNQRHVPGGCCCVRFPCMLVNITMILLSIGICLPIICPARKRRMEAFDQDMRELVRDLNRMVTERLPFLTQSFLVKTQSEPDGSRGGLSWFTFALTAEEAKKLKAEPHIQGSDIENCKCCGGADVNEYCMCPPMALYPGSGR